MNETETETNETLALPASVPPEPPPGAAFVAGEQVPPPDVAPAKTTRRGGALVSLLLFILILLLAAGEGLLWQRGQAAGPGAVAALQSQINALKAAQSASAAPAPSPTTVAAASNATPPPPAAASAASSAAPSAAPSAADQAQAAQLAAMAPKLSALSAQVNVMGDELSADHGIVTGLQTSTANLAKLSDHMAQAEKLSAARAALESGQPVGVIANAPAALAQFATTAPPSEARLRLGFPQAARDAESASVTADGKPSFWSRVKARVEGLITISDGTHVLMGAPAAGVLEQARVLLDAGDLKDAVAQINTLSQPTQAAMGDWLTQARALLAARAALTTLSGQS